MSLSRNLSIALNFTKIVLGFVCCIFLLFILLIISSLIGHEWSDLYVNSEAFQAKFGIGNFRWCNECIGSDLLLNELEPQMKLWLLTRGGSFFLLVGLSLLQIIKLLRSIKNKNTFYKGNIEAFQRLALYGFIISILSAFNFYSYEEHFIFYSSIPFGPLAFTLACKVLSDIFKEGKNLSEDNQSII